MPDLASQSYWDDRARTTNSLIETVLVDSRAGANEAFVRTILRPFREGSCLDVACGYGRMSDAFVDYTGVDFSPEMIARGTSKKMIVADIHKDLSFIDRKYDIIFCLIALSSLKMTPREFNEKFKDYAKKAVMVFELDEMFIFPRV